MRFLLDQDVYAKTVSFLRNADHDVIRVAELGLSRAIDETVLETARAQNQILITRDRDYGNLVFVRSLGSGVIYLRISPATLASVHAELSRVISRYSQDQLSSRDQGWSSVQAITTLRALLALK
jgi:predicted nuclease of predicted toxin-antitoxin system